MKLLPSIVLIGLAGMTAGCATSNPNIAHPPVPATSPARPLSGAFSITGVGLDFRPAHAAQVVHIEVSYSLSVSEPGRTKNVATLERAFSLKSPEGTLLLAYIARHALDALNGGPTPPGMVISAPPGTDLAQGRPWWFAETETTFVNLETLALRHGDEVLSPAGTTPQQAAQWQPLDPPLYERWYRLLDDRLSLEQLFAASH